jgi:hypothetical protein
MIICCFVFVYPQQTWGSNGSGAKRPRGKTPPSTKPSLTKKPAMQKQTKADTEIEDMDNKYSQAMVLTGGMRFSPERL